MITVYIDLDDVLADFDKTFQMDKFDRDEFKRKVMDERLFETLDFMPNAENLIRTLERYDDEFGLNIEILSSLGAPNDRILQDVVANQKCNWLESKGLHHYSKNFTIHKGFKKLFATPKSILIDDCAQNIWDFDENHGHGFLYDDSTVNMDDIGILITRVHYYREHGIYGRQKSI